MKTNLADASDADGGIRRASILEPMSLVSSFLFSALALSQSAAAPTPVVQAGIAAYHRGDFTAAMAILKPVVYDTPPRAFTVSSDPLAKAYLAQMSRRGEGTPMDWPLACALFNDVWSYTHSGGMDRIGTIPFVEEGIREVCLSSPQEEVSALRRACYLDGVTRREFVLDGNWVVFDRRGFHIDRGGQHADYPPSMWCHELVLSLTQSDISVADYWSTDRVHFLELFKWTNGFDEARDTRIRQLHWQVYQVRGTDLRQASDQIVLTVTGGPYPSSDLPREIREAVGLQLNAAGQIEWFVKGTTDRRGIIPNPPRAEVSTTADAPSPTAAMEQPASDFALRFDHKGCHYEYLDTFKGTYSGGGGGPRPFALSSDQRLTLFKAIAAARIFDLPEVVAAGGGEPSGNYELEVRNGGTRRTVAWNRESADRSLTTLTRTVLEMVNPRPGDGCIGGPPKVR